MIEVDFACVGRTDCSSSSLAVRWIVRIRIHKMRHVGCASSSSSLNLLFLLLLLLFPLLLLAVRWILNLRHYKMRQLGIIPLGRILTIEAKDEQIRTNTFFVQQLQNV